MSLKIELLNSKIHNRSNFDCGKESLNRYLVKTASQDLKRKVATVFVLVDCHNQVLAYYTLSAFTIEVLELELSVAKKLPRYPRLPATMLGRLAVDINYQGRNFGKLMLVNALLKAYENTKTIAPIAVVVDAIDDKASNFYKKYGFVAFKS
ncbi:GNAT family N-acetyltransferase [Myxosarcina sp. GI1]|uniref:GNAT family N-acetyltransferase n=1 Tax=Myxosarcina sp. GI1 TaxID=1541065 RepID=UPI00068F512F|nr:GNAT family N-acetyltransferase [Myxosarcina sp. GI1]